MYQKILVAIDDSTAAQQIFDQALALAKPLQAQLMLLHVLSMEEEGYPDFYTIPSLHYYPGLADLPLDTYRHQWQSYEQRGLDRLNVFAQQAQEAGVNAEIAQRSGAAGHLICELGKSWGADLIYMGSRGRAGLSELLLGSVSNFVMHHAPCSVLVMRGEVSQQPIDVDVASSLNRNIDSYLAEPVCSIPQQEQRQALSHLSGWQ